MLAPAPRSAGRPVPAHGACLGHCARTTGGVKVAAAWWNGLAAKPAARGRAAFARRELACGGLDGEGNGGVIERDEGELPERSRGARAPARARPGCDICYDIFCIL